MKAVSLMIIAAIFGAGVFHYSVSILQISKALKRRKADVKTDKVGVKTRFFKYYTLISTFMVPVGIYLLSGMFPLDSITKILSWLAMIILISSIPVLSFSTYLIKLYPAKNTNS